MVFKLLQENSDVILKEDGDALLLEILGLLPESVSGNFQFGGVDFSTQVDLPVASATGTFSLGGVDFTTRADLDVSSLAESFTFGDTTVKLTVPMNVDSLVEGFDFGDVDFTTQVDLDTDSLVEGFSFGDLALIARGLHPLKVDSLDVRVKFGRLAFNLGILPSSVAAAFRIGGVYDLEEYFFFSNPRGRGVPRLSYPLPDPPSIHLWRRVLSEFRGQNLWIDHDGVVHGGYPDDLADAAYIFLSARTHRVSPEVAEILTEAGFTTEPEYVGS